MAISLGILCYDVPIDQKAVYNKLRASIRRHSLPMTWSVYLIPWALKEDIERILKDIVVDKGFYIRYKILKFDDSDQAALDRACIESIEQLLAQAKTTLHKRLLGASEKLAEMENTAEWERDSLWAVRKARDSLEEAQKLAFVFNMSDEMDFAFAALTELLKAERQAVEAKYKGKNEAKITL